MGCVAMNTIIVLDWKFLPPNYFEEAIEISRLDCTIRIADGQVHAKIDFAMYETKPRMREELHEALNERFLAVQLFTHRAYELSPPEVARVHPDGHRDVFGELEDGLVVTYSGDFRVTDKDGNVIEDLKRDRVEKQKRLAELIASHEKDTALALVLRSYSTAVRDPNDELVHLYEIREALWSKFNKDGNATKTALGISGTLVVSLWTTMLRRAAAARATPWQVWGRSAMLPKAN